VLRFEAFGVGSRPSRPKTAGTQTVFEPGFTENEGGSSLSRGGKVVREAAVSTNPKTFLTPEQYLEIERKAEFKSEYFDGVMFTMAGAKEAHNLLAMNVGFALHPQLRSRPCRIYANDMRVRVSATVLYTYPDVIAVCGERHFLDDQRDTLLNPNLIVEVLSPTTEAYDRGRKFEYYKAIESFTEYLLISSDRVHVDLFRRQRDGDWLLKSAERMEDVFELQSVGCRLSLADLYEQVELATS
jgi:Uma2 family endonuclease